MSQDPEARVAVETFVTTGLVVVGGEVTHNDAARLAIATEHTVEDGVRYLVDYLVRVAGEDRF